jgi:hypothetical protein
MARVETSTASPAGVATARVMDAEIDRVIAGSKSCFPNFAKFVASDVVTDDIIRASHANGQTVVIVDEHEHVRVLPAP